MLDNVYEVVITPDFRTFEFRSIGPKGAVLKIIRYVETELPGFYNLGFGDLDPITRSIDDLIATNNGDAKKILQTVASTLYIFTDQYPEAIVFATGSTNVRTRLYRMGISNNLEAIEKDFTIKGYFKEDWEPFALGIPYEAFLVRRKL
ncbi:DUF6934 family protein [Dyadobacter sp. CY323]|uniref:DUF6934 family protein n=1 Tax=Dyadobacter sp. CY323 TaxID=2907302 RepID=UPI001F161262|nr:hypothetical protein [Dyadobacter sp. CY323]MCE6988491.1 hypothetical protein [Dyadobacter sp. CY323]